MWQGFHPATSCPEVGFGLARNTMMPFDANMSDIRDEDLLAAFTSGDALAAKALTQRFGPLCYGVAFRMLGNQAEAEDIAQDAMMKLWKMAPDWESGRAKISTWLYRITSNLCIDHLRRRSFAPGDEVPDVADESVLSAESSLQNKARSDALQTALMQLPERQRQAIVLRHIEGLSNPEIAQIMETSIEAVESLSGRAKRALTDILSPQKKALGLI